MPLKYLPPLGLIAAFCVSAVEDEDFPSLLATIKAKASMLPGGTAVQGALRQLMNVLGQPYCPIQAAKRAKEQVDHTLISYLENVETAQKVCQVASNAKETKPRVHHHKHRLAAFC